LQSQKRMLEILDLFEGRRLKWTVEELLAASGLNRSTLYRNLKVLSDAGLLSSLPGIGYTLGPRIVELDFMIRTGDPLIRLAQPAMEELVSQFKGVALLCRRYREKVLCVHQETSTSAILSSYQRGYARDLFHGAASVIILANLQSHQLTKLYQKCPEEFAAGGIGASLVEVRKHLREPRQRGWMATSGEVTEGVTGVAAPIFDARQEVIGSLSLTMPVATLDETKLEAVAAQVVFCSRIVTKSLARAD
jgi:DNA-binding IclR family transcriptional regulator